MSRSWRLRELARSELATTVVIVGVAAVLVVGTMIEIRVEGPHAFVPPTPPGRSLHLAPIGGFPLSQANALAEHYRRRFGLEVDILPSLPLPPNSFVIRRDQIAAERLTETLRQHPVYIDQGAVIVGLTDVDMFIESEDWTYAYSYRLAYQLAVVSTARLGADGADPELRQERLEKMVTKNIGVLFYDLPLSSNPRSVLYDNVLGPWDLDRMSEDFLVD